MLETINSKKVKEIVTEEHSNCPVERALKLLGGKWKPSILFNLREKPMRFNELLRSLPGASKNILNQRLQEMEELGLVNREVKVIKPLAVEYSITDIGREVLKSFDHFDEWAKKNDI
tara:strand:+ start:3478 stop:3828 length:351 start_codon:yes stop_codon:yes gene_type:complete